MVRLLLGHGDSISIEMEQKQKNLLAFSKGHGANFKVQLQKKKRQKKGAKEKEHLEDFGSFDLRGKNEYLYDVNAHNCLNNEVAWMQEFQLIQPEPNAKIRKPTLEESKKMSRKWQTIWLSQKLGQDP